MNDNPSQYIFTPPADGIYHPRLGCKIGLHRWRSSGPRQKRSDSDPCAIETEYYRGQFIIPMERCLDCGNERVQSVTVIGTSERPNPFRRPRYDCQCGIGNDEHHRRWQERIDQLKKLVDENNF